jgi:carbonic anhydrase/acetyltransferase-like protein (isoleucine patch superfamily)
LRQERHQSRVKSQLSTRLKQHQYSILLPLSAKRPIMSTTDPSHRQSTSSTTRPSSKRISTAPTAPRAPTNLHPTSTIANHALLTGHYPITISANTILHPYAKIISSEGPVEIGEGSIVWEKGVVGIMSDQGDGEEKATILGRNVVIETGAVVEAGTSIGEGSVVEGFARVGEGCVVGKVILIRSISFLRLLICGSWCSTARSWYRYLSLPIQCWKTSRYCMVRTSVGKIRRWSGINWYGI